MALTVTNTNTLVLLNILNRNLAAQSNTLRQLTTGMRINSGKDDPAGLIALEHLNAELTAVNAALANNQRTDAMLSVADAAMGEISSLLGEIEKLVVASSDSANLSDAELAANQAQIDNALAAIDRIVQTTSFNGKKLLDGSLGLQHSDLSGNPNVSNLRIFSQSHTTSSQTLTVTRVASAQRASATFALAGPSARTSGTTEVVIAGELGAVTLTLADDLKQSEIVSAINAVTDQTGVSATRTPSSIELNSLGYGRDAFISVEVLSGGTINANPGQSDGDPSNDIQNVARETGTDAIVTVNGLPAGTNGLDVYYTANGWSLAFSLSEDFARGATEATTSFTVYASGGATFQLGTTVGTRVTIGIDSLATYNLGGGNASERLSELRSDGALSLRTDVAGALRVVRKAIGEVAEVRARIGAFQKYQVGSAIRSLEAAKESLTKATSAIGDVDFAVATAELNRQQVLIQAGMTLLGVVNLQTAQVLSLL